MAAIFRLTGESLSAKCAVDRYPNIYRTTAEFIGMPPGEPLGNFYLFPAYQVGSPPDPSAAGGLTNPNIQGILWRETWERINPTGAGNDWTYLESAVGQCETNSKLSSMQNLAGSTSPDWVFAAGAQKLVYTVGLGQTPDPSTVPWDPVFQRLWELLNIDMASHFDGRLAIVVMSGVGNASESFLVRDGDTVAADMASANVLAVAAGYPDAVTAWTYAMTHWMIDMYMRVWRNTPVVLVTGIPFPDSEGGTTALQAAFDYGDAKYRGRFGVRPDNLNSSGPNPGDFSANLMISMAPHSRCSLFQYANHQVANDPGPPARLIKAIVRAEDLFAHGQELFTDDADDPLSAAPLHAANIDFKSVDIARRIAVVKRTASESLSTSDATIGVKLGALNRTATQSLTLSESVRLGLGRQTAENPILSESVGRTLTATRKPLDVASTSELTIASKATLVSRTATESLSVAESLVRFGNRFRTATEALSAVLVAPQVQGPATIYKTTLNAVAQFDPGTGAFPIGVFEARGTVPINFATSDRPQLAINSPSGGLVIYNNGAFGYYNPFQTVFAWGVGATATDAIRADDVATRPAHLFTVTTTDHLTISESATSHTPQFRTAVDALSVALVAGRTLAALRSATDALTILQSVVRHLTFVRSASDALVVSELVTRLVGILRAAVDALVVTDSASYVAPGHLLRLAADALHTAETAKRTVNWLRSANDALSVAVVSVLIGDLHRLAADLLELSEQAEREAADKTRFAVDFLHISELLDRIRVAGLFDYLLPFPTGNLPLVSTLVVPLADSELLNVVATSALSGPIADCNLIGFVAQSAIGHEQATSNLQNVTTGSSLAYVEL